MTITGRHFICPDKNCSDLRVKFIADQPNQFILYKAQWLSETQVKVKIPKYTKPDVLTVELTLNGQDYTNDKK